MLNSLHTVIQLKHWTN